MPLISLPAVATLATQDPVSKRFEILDQRIPLGPRQLRTNDAGRKFSLVGFRALKRVSEIAVAKLRRIEAGKPSRACLLFDDLEANLFRVELAAANAESGRAWQKGASDYQTQPAQRK